LRLLLKRIVDLALVIPGIILVSPVMLVVWVMVARRLGRPVLFGQTRPGLAGRPFRMYKFRTMLDARDAHGNPLPDEQRITAFGRLLRSTSLDELPELLNVLLGDMSLVGPRPLLMEYLDRYTSQQARRHEMPPGITGWAQVNGRNAVTWEEKFELDVWYVDHWTLGLDLQILWMTIGKVLRRDGISANGEATMSAFMGSGPGGDAK
jgi:sugar transferase EpsL